MRKNHLLVWGVGGVLLLTTAMVVVRARLGPGVPADAAAVTARAGAVGLTVVPVPTGGGVVAATVPTTPRDAEELPARDWTGPRWTGRVRVYPDPHRQVVLGADAPAVRWGAFVVVGDPDVVERLTGRRP